MNGCRFVACQRGRMLVCCFLVFFAFMVYAPLAEAEEVQDMDDLTEQISGADDDATIRIEAGKTIIFPNTSNALLIEKEGVTLQGGTSGNFDTKIGDLSGLINGQGTGITLEKFSDAVDSWKIATSYNAGISPGILSGIAGNNSDRTKPFGDNDPTKWLTTTHGGGDSSANGLSLQDLRFGDVNAVYSNGKYVNGIIGNDNDVSGLTSMDGITGNVFNAINVTLKGSRVCRHESCL